MSRVHAVVIALGSLSLLAALASFAGVPALEVLAEGPVALGNLLWPTTLGVALLLYALQHQGFVFYWKRESTKISLEEIALFGGLLILPPASLILALVASSLLNQVVHRRELAKAAFNVGQYALAALVTVASCAGLRQVGVPSPWFALPSPLLFYTLTALQVSVLFAQLEHVSPFRVFTQRFGRFVLVGAALGTSLGLVLVALYALHPLAALAVVPLFIALRRFGMLSEWADDEITTHRLVASASAEVAGRADLDSVAARILSTCDELFDPGEATLTLAREHDASPRVWRTKDGPVSGTGGVTAEILGLDGRSLGTLNVFPKPGQTRYGEREQQLLRTVAAAVTAAAANAEALRRAEEANEELAESERRLRLMFDTTKTLEHELRLSVSRQEETIKRLENVNRELEQFTLWTTHDMREPLRSIGTIAGFLHDDLGKIELDEARDLARRICEGSDRLKDRVKALHAFSMIVQRDDEFEDVDMQGVIEDIVASLETKIGEKRATIVLPGTRFPLIRAQPHRIDQVFGNLVENALKYGRESDGMVEIGFVEDANEWRFFVRDDGPGIPAAYQERVFQLFQRGPGAKEAGSGAGLAIVKRIAEQHGGRSWVESAEGRGATFLVALPKPTPHAILRKAF